MRSSVLHRQLIKFGLSTGSPPNQLDEWRRFLADLLWRSRDEEKRRTMLAHARNVASQHYDDKRAELQDSKALYMSLVECIPLSVFRVDLNGRHIFVNARYSRMLANSKTKILGRTYSELFSSELSMEYRRQDLQVFETKKATTFSISLDRNYFEVSKSPIFNGNHVIVGIQGIFWDTTKFTQAELESEHKYSTLFENSKDAISITTPEGQILNVNQSMVDLYGYTEKQLLEMNADKLYVNPSIRNQFRSRLENEGFVKNFDVKLKTRDGIHLDVQLSASTYSAHQGDEVEFQTIHHDVTERTRREDRLEEKYINIRAGLNLEDRYETLAGTSDSMQKIKAKIDEISGPDPIVLITGETGTGKSLLAWEIHHSSSRSEGKFWPVIFPEISETLFESEMFGHRRGAFTDAKSDRVGHFERADGGTIFLDEIGDLPLNLQSKLLRVIQEQEFVRVGDSEVTKVDVRIIAATNRPLAADVAAGRFRQDLFFRLNVYPIDCPPLRERTEDIPILVENLLKNFNKRYKRGIGQNEVERLHEDDLKRLKRHHWPGNIRELENTIETAVIKSRSHYLDLSDWNPRNDALLGGEPTRKFREIIAEVEQTEITKALISCNWKISGANSASEYLDVNDKTLHSMMKRLGIEKPTNK